MLRKAAQRVVTCFTLILVLSVGTVHGADATANLEQEVINAANAYSDAQSGLSAVQQQYPAFYIQGEINDVGDGSSITVYGTAMSGTAGANTPGWQMEDGNIMILSPKQDEVDYISNFFYGKDLFYVETVYGKNRLGGEVPVKIYTYAKEQVLVDAESLVNAAYEALRAKAETYKSHIISKYERLLDSADVAGLISNGNDVLASSHFLVQNANDSGLLDLVVSFFKRITSLAPDNMDAWVALADIYKDNHNIAELYDANLAIAKLSTDVFLERMDINTDIANIASILKEAGYPELVAAQYEAYFSANKDSSDTEIHEGYINTLYELSAAQADSESKLPYLLKILDAIEALRVAAYIDEDMQNLQKDIRGSLYTIYFEKGDLDSANQYNELLDNYGTNAKDDTIDAQTLQLADSYARVGDFGKAGSSFHTVIAKYRKGYANEDIQFESDSANANLALADKYLEFYDTSYEGYDNLKNCLKYLSKAYRINPNDAKINNALGYVYEAYYNSSEDAFSSLQSTALSGDDLAVKVISLYLKAIEADPTYKAAFGNLYWYCSDKYGGVDKNLAMQKAGIDDTFLDGYYSNSLDENGITQMGFLRY
jgi:hypothetical protein